MYKHQSGKIEVRSMSVKADCVELKLRQQSGVKPPPFDMHELGSKHTRPGIALGDGHTVHIVQEIVLADGHALHDIGPELADVVGNIKSETWAVTHYDRVKRKALSYTYDATVVLPFDELRHEGVDGVPGEWMRERRAWINDAVWSRAPLDLALWIEPPAQGELAFTDDQRAIVDMAESDPERVALAARLVTRYGVEGARAKIAEIQGGA